MRTLRFIVKEQRIVKDPSCDFSGLVHGSSGYLKAAFTFDSCWDGCAKAASFFRMGGKEFAAALAGNECTIPDEALTRSAFEVSVTGAKPGYRLRTNRVTVEQGG